MELWKDTIEKHMKEKNFQQFSEPVRRITADFSSSNLDKIIGSMDKCLSLVKSRETESNVNQSIFYESIHIRGYTFFM